MYIPLALPATADRQVPAHACALDDLTARETEVLLLVARGRTNAKIAGELFLGMATVKTHIRRLLSKLGARDRIGIAVRAYAAGLVAPGDLLAFPQHPAAVRRGSRSHRSERPEMATAALRTQPAVSAGPVAPLFGLLVVAAFVGANLVEGSGAPAADASAAKAVAYWSAHADGQMAASALFAVSSAALLAFASALRAALAPLSEQLARIAWSGGVVAAAGILTIVSITFAAADTAGDVDPAVTQTLSVLNEDFFFPMATGFGVMILAGGLALLRTGGAVRWFGVLSILLGVLGFTPAGIVLYYATPVWIGVVSLMLILRPAVVRRAE